MVSDMSAKIGRPKLEVTRAVLVGARFTAAEAEQIAKAARESQQVKSEWIRQALLAAAGNSLVRPAAPLASAAVSGLKGDEFLD
jgi:hypothetical protein